MTTTQQYMDEMKRTAGVLPILAGGAIIGLAASDHLFAPDEQLIGIGFSLAVLFGVAVPLLIGGYWLTTTSYDARQLRRVTSWCLAGSIPLLVLSAVTVVYERSHGVVLADSEFVLAAVAGVGLLGGLLTGVYDVRQDLEKQAHQKTASRLDTIIHGAPVAIITVNDDGIVKTWNEAAEALFGWRRDEVFGQPCPVEPVDRPSETNGWCACLNEDGGSGELQSRRKDGSRISVERWSTTIPNTNGDRSERVGIFTDITERDRRRQQLAVLQRILRHNLRNTVNVIEGYANLIGEELSDPELHDAATTIAIEARKLENLGERAGEIESILQANPGEGSTIDLVEVIEETRSELQNASPEASITVHSPDSLVVHTNVSVEPAFREAMTNAVKHSDGTGPQVRVSVDGHPSESDSVVVSVADDGPGIPEPERLALQGKEETPLEHTSGIGLWLIKWVITTAGGAVELLDNEPRGSVVRMTLPSN